LYLQVVEELVEFWVSRDLEILADLKTKRNKKLDHEAEFNSGKMNGSSTNGSSTNGLFGRF
jgi:hypothetical protein